MSIVCLVKKLIGKDPQLRSAGNVEFIWRKSLRETLHGAEAIATGTDRQAAALDSLLYQPLYYNGKTTIYVKEDQVLRNVQSCLNTTRINEADVITSQRLASKSKENALQLTKALRRVIPLHFSTSDSPCWNTTLELSLRGNRVNGRIGSLKFHDTLSKYRKKAVNQLKSLRHVSFSKVCLPKVFILGVAKCGSTFLYCLTVRIAELFSLERGQIDKEPFWWHAPTTHSSGIPQPDDIARYLFTFYPGAQSLLNSKRMLTIDATPLTLTGDHELTIENYCLIPSVLPEVLPTSQYIVVMREPVSTLYSYFWYSCSQLDIRLSKAELQDAPSVFHRRVVQVLHKLQTCFKYNPIDYCVLSYSHQRPNVSPLYFHSCGNIKFEKTLYYLMVRKWLSTVPREKFLFLTTEALSKDTLSVAGKIATFLGLSDFNARNISQEKVNNFASMPKDSCVNKQMRYNYHSNPSLQMQNTTKTLLSEFFTPYNQKLAALLGDKEFLWTL